MTREEQIIQASDEWTYQKPPQYSELVHKTRKVMCAYQVGFIDGAVWADAHPNWISVDDELPKERGNYFVATRHMVCQSEYYPDMNNPWHTPFFPLGNIADVTHWMPMPSPPTKKGGEK